MPRTFTTQDITDVDIDQIIITRTRDEAGNSQVRVRANVTVTLKDSIDPLRTTTMNVAINRTIQELSVGPQVNAIRLAVLNAAKTQLA